MLSPKKTKLFPCILVFTVLVLSLFLGGCGQESSKEGKTAETKKVIRIGMVNWADCIAMTNIFKVILEEELGYEVKTTYADIAVIFSAIAQKDYDLYVDAWLPVTHKTYMEEYGDKMEIISPTYKGARIGLVVPTYVTIDAIPQLNDYKEKFRLGIVGIDTGAGIMKATETAVKEYNLDLDLKSSSGPVMTATLKGAIEKDQWVVVTGWKPHWKFARWDLKFLDDPKKIYGEVENTYAVGHTEFRQKFPDVTALLENFLLTDQQLGEVMGLIAESNDKPYEVVKKWAHDHKDAVKKWVE